MLTCVQVTVAMDAKDLRTESALSERNNDGSKYSQSGGIALHCDRNKSYQDIGSNSLAKVDVPSSRPCAVIGPDRVVPPPPSNETYLKKGSVEPWPCMGTAYRRPPEYPHKLANFQNPTRNISPRQTFQENMQRIMVPPTYNSVKLSDDTSYTQLSDRNNALSKNMKVNVPPEAKFCDVPYTVYPPSNEQKNVRNPEMCLTSVNPTLTRTAPHGWPPGSVNIRPSRVYGAPELYQYQEFPSCAGPRPVVPRSNRTVPEESGYVYDVPYCHQEGNIRFKPYPTVKERFPQQRYEYIGNYTNSFHPPPTFPSHKYELQKPVPPHPYPQYPPIKYLDRVPEPVMEGYQRNQQGNYNVAYRNQIIHPNYGPVVGNGPPNKIHSYPPDAHIKTVAPNKLPYDNTKAYIEYENGRHKMYATPDSYILNEMGRMHPMKSQVIMPNYPPLNMHNIPTNPYYKKDNQHMKNYEYIQAHFRSMDPNMNIHNPMIRHPPVFSPNTLAISPTDSSASNDTSQTLGTSQEDCGYVSQSSTASVRSMDSGIHRIPNDCLRKYYDSRYGPIIRTPSMMAKSELNSNSHSKEKKNIDVRQFLQMWNEGDEEGDENNSKQIIISTGPKIDHNLSKTHEVMTSNQEQLYVLGLVNVPSEELDKYEHIQKVSKLPENIKGYNNLELLNQFEEVTESTNMANYKSSTPKDFQMPLKGAPPKQIGIGPPRPLSPLDVEAKISQSVIHKEVGCNFEIKPCSPKMLNVEVATPVQNILAERAIEKVTNPVMLKSPRLNSIDENIDCNLLKRPDQRLSINNEPVRIPSCKMINTQFSSNNSIDSMKNSYSLQDLESNSGLCLASLPRLDNDIELNFPEVNQQFINANKGDSTILTPSLRDLPSLEVLGQSEHNSKDKINDINLLTQETEITKSPCIVDSEKEFSKLSKYRKSKTNSFDSKENQMHHNMNAARTDSVIIKNPENVKNYEENSLFSPNSLMKEDSDIQRAPINLTQGTITENAVNTSTTIETNNVEQDINSSIEIAIDFSINKSTSDYNDNCPTTNSEKETGLQTIGTSPANHSVLNDDHLNKLPIFSDCTENMQENPNYSKIEKNVIQSSINNSDSEAVVQNINKNIIDNPPLEDIFMENACLSPLASIEGDDDDSECMSPAERDKALNNVEAESLLPIEFMAPTDELLTKDIDNNDSYLMDIDKNNDIVEKHLDKANDTKNGEHIQNDAKQKHIIDEDFPNTEKMDNKDSKDLVETKLDSNTSENIEETESSIIDDIEDINSTNKILTINNVEPSNTTERETNVNINLPSSNYQQNLNNSMSNPTLQENVSKFNLLSPNNTLSQKQCRPDDLEPDTAEHIIEPYSSSNKITTHNPNTNKSDLADPKNNTDLDFSKDIEMQNHSDEDLVENNNEVKGLYAEVEEVSQYRIRPSNVDEKPCENNTINLPDNVVHMSQTPSTLPIEVTKKFDNRVTRYLSYGSKEMYSPWMQKLVTCCEGNIGHVTVNIVEEDNDCAFVKPEIEKIKVCDNFHSCAENEDNSVLPHKIDPVKYSDTQSDVQDTMIETTSESFMMKDIKRVHDEKNKIENDEDDTIIESDKQDTTPNTKEVKHLPKNRDIENELHIILTGSPLVNDTSNHLENSCDNQDSGSNHAGDTCFSIKTQKQRDQQLNYNPEKSGLLDEQSILNNEQYFNNDEISKRLEVLHSSQPNCDGKDGAHFFSNDEISKQLEALDSRKSICKDEIRNHFNRQPNHADNLSNQFIRLPNHEDDVLDELNKQSNQKDVTSHELKSQLDHDYKMDDLLVRKSSATEELPKKLESESNSNDNVSNQFDSQSNEDEKMEENFNINSNYDSEKSDNLNIQLNCTDDQVDRPSISVDKGVDESDSQSQYYKEIPDHCFKKCNDITKTSDILDIQFSCDDKVLDKQLNCDKQLLDELNPHPNPTAEQLTNSGDEVPKRSDTESNCHESLQNELDRESKNGKLKTFCENTNIDGETPSQMNRPSNLNTEIVDLLDIQPNSNVESPKCFDCDSNDSTQSKYINEINEHNNKRSSCNVVIPKETINQSNDDYDISSQSGGLSHCSDHRSDGLNGQDDVPNLFDDQSDYDDNMADQLNKQPDCRNEIISHWDTQPKCNEEAIEQSDSQSYRNNEILDQLEKESDCDNKILDQLLEPSNCNEERSDQLVRQINNDHEITDQLDSMSDSVKKSVSVNLEVESSTIVENEELSWTNIQTTEIMKKQRKSLKRSLSDSALNVYGNSDSSQQDNEENVQFLWPIKRKKINNVDSDILAQNLCNIIQSNRRNSISSIYNEENVSFCILIDNSCIIAEEENEEQQKLCLELPEECLAEIQNEFTKDVVEEEANTEVQQQESGCEYSDSFVMQGEDEKDVDESWVEDVACVETVISDDIAEDIEISSQASKDDEMSDNDESGVFSSSGHTDKVKYIYGDKMCNDDAKFVETLYNTPQMDVNKTLCRRETLISGECYDNDSLEKILSESNEPELSPYIPEYSDPVYSPSIIDVKETADDKENVDLETLSQINPSKDLNTGTNTINNENNLGQLYCETQNDTVHSCESSVDDVFTYKESGGSTNYITSSSPEVSSTTSEDRNSAILLKITNYKGSRTSQINDISRVNKRPSCKFTEDQGYVQSQSNYSAHRPLLTKAAQKYIPPLKESMRDLKVKLSLPQHSLIKLKQLKKTKDEPKVCKQNISVPKVSKKPKPKFEDVLKSIDEIQFKMHKEKTKKSKKSIPKVVIKKNENGSHYASTSSKDEFNPDLTGRKWQPWVFIEKNHFIDKMAIKKKTKAIYSHRKKAYVLAEKFRKYKSVNSAKFVISPPISDCPSTGLKYTIRLKHTY